MSEAYRVSYGLEVSPGQILRAPTPPDVVDTAGWLRTVERRYEPVVSRRVFEWRLLAGTALLAMALLSMIQLLPGRIPRWIRGPLVTGNFVLPMVILLLLSLESNVIANYMFAPLRPLYVAIFDRPGTLTFALAVLSVALYLRHLRVFRTSEIVEPAARA